MKPMRRSAPSTPETLRTGAAQGRPVVPSGVAISVARAAFQSPLEGSVNVIGVPPPVELGPTNVRSLPSPVSVACTGRANLVLENIAVRHQLGAFRRAGRRPRVKFRG